VRADRVFEELLTVDEVETLLPGTVQFLVAADRDRGDILLNLRHTENGETATDFGCDQAAFGHLLPGEARWLAGMLQRAADSIDPSDDSKVDRAMLDVKEWPYGGDHLAEGDSQ
jgi:hypothetical protein